MNNIIKELMRDAIGKSFNGPDPDGDVKKMYIPHVFVEHFTALIVAECGKITEQQENIGRRDLDWSLVFKDHFGIK